MTVPKEKPEKPQVRSREPKKATPSGMFDNLRQLPHPIEEIIGLAPTSIEPNPTHPIPSHPIPSQPIPTHPNLPPAGQNRPEPAPEASKLPVAPERDFNKRANSVDRDALPAGIFPGTSKKLYDALYLKTRGSIQPTRTVQATKRELMLWSGIRSKNTIALNLKILSTIGLVVPHHEIGDHDGSIYEVFLPEEIVKQPIPSHPIPSQPNPTQKLGGDPTQLLGWVGLGNPVDSKEDSAPPKTLIKTIEIDDDDGPLAGLNTALKQAAKEVTGREPSAAETGRWRELGELLAAELRIAASRTTVSSVPAFLTAHLRKRLFKRDVQQIEREVAEAREAASLDEQATRAHKPHLSAEELQEQVNLVVRLMREGRTAESLDQEFAAGFKPTQWQIIRSMAMAQFRVAGHAETENPSE